MTSAAGGCLTEELISTMRSPWTRTSPGVINFPFSISRRRAAWRTIACFEAGGVDCAKTRETEAQVSNRTNSIRKARDSDFIVPVIISLPRFSCLPWTGCKKTRRIDRILLRRVVRHSSRKNKAKDPQTFSRQLKKREKPSLRAVGLAKAETARVSRRSGRPFCLRFPCSTR